jgi:hypothetical protein
MAPGTTLVDDGLRVLVFAANATVTTLHDASGEIALPALRPPMASAALADEVAPAGRRNDCGVFQDGHPTQNHLG